MSVCTVVGIVRRAALAGNAQKGLREQLCAGSLEFEKFQRGLAHFGDSRRVGRISPEELLADLWVSSTRGENGWPRAKLTNRYALRIRGRAVAQVVVRDGAR